MSQSPLNKNWTVSENIVTLSVPITFWEFELPKFPKENYSTDQLHLDVERIIKEHGDWQKRRTDVKALMTNWVMTEHEPFKIISDTVEDIIQTIWHERSSLDLKTFMTTCWGAIYSRGDYSEPHQHIPALYSWVYYVKCDEESAPLHFNWFPGHTYKPTPGKGIIFPGYVQHNVPAHKSDNERIIVVGNVEGTGEVTYPQVPLEERFYKIK